MPRPFYKPEDALLEARIADRRMTPDRSAKTHRVDLSLVCLIDISSLQWIEMAALSDLNINVKVMN